MGVPSLFRWLTRKYPQIIERASPHNPTDILYIDFNAVIHVSCSPSDGPTPRTEEAMMSNIRKNLDRIVEKSRPRKMLVISTDGVAPRAKLNQQRGRRYRSIIEALEEKKGEIKSNRSKDSIKSKRESFQTKKNDVKEDYKVDFVGLLENSTSEDVEEISESWNVSQSHGSKQNESVLGKYDKHISDLLEERSVSSEDQDFDKNAITPGTQFMYDLERGMDSFFKDRLKSHPHYKNLSCIYSNGRRAGEGEQKIMNVIRKSKNKNLHHTIFSPDADLIFLGASLHGRNVKIMRGDLEFSQQQRQNFCGTCRKKGHLSTYCNKLALFSCIFFDCTTLKRMLSDELSFLIRFPFEFNRILDDWIMMSFLAGNDFLPTLQCFDVRFEAIEILTTLLAKNFNITKKYITKHGEIDFSILHNFFKLLESHEDSLYLKKKRLLFEARRRFQSKGHFENIPLNTRHGKTKYYDTKLNLKSEQEVIRVCREYILGLSWVLKYYVKGFTNWEWFYPHDYAPFACDLANVHNMPYLNKKTAPLDCLEQQMLVMPPQSKNLVPKEMHSILTQFPTEIKVDMFDKLLPWQGVAILPFITVKPLLDQTNEQRALLTYDDAVRGVESSDLFYVNHNNKFFRQIRDMYLKGLPYVDISLDFELQVKPFFKYEMDDDKIVIAEIEHFK